MKSILKNKFTSNTTWLLVGKFIDMSISFAVGILVARYMSEEDYGIYNYALSIVTIFAVFSNLGISNILTKEIVNQKFSETDILNSAFYLKFFGSILAIVLSLLFVVVFQNTTKVLFYVFIVALPILIKSLDFISYYFDAKVLSKYNVQARTVGIALSNLLKLFTVIFNLDIIFIYSAVLFDAIVFCSILYFFFKRNTSLKINLFAKSKETLKILLEQSLPLMFTGIIYIFYLKIDQIMIKEILSAKHLGYYSAAVKLSSTWYTIPWIITGSLFPALLNSLKISTDLFYKRFVLLCQFLVILSIVAIIPISLFADEIILAIYKGKYFSASSVLKIHIWSSLFVFVGYAGSKWLIAQNLQKLALTYMCIGAVFNVVFNLLFIPKYGINGAAYVTLLSQALTYIIAPAFSKKSRKLFYLQIISILEAFTIILPIINLKNALKEKTI